jgi:hypothetical protein
MRKRAHDQSHLPMVFLLSSHLPPWDSHFDILLSSHHAPQHRDCRLLYLLRRMNLRARRKRAGERGRGRERKREKKGEKERDTNTSSKVTRFQERPLSLRHELQTGVKVIMSAVWVSDELEWLHDLRGMPQQILHSALQSLTHCVAILFDLPKPQCAAYSEGGRGRGREER